MPSPMIPTNKFSVGGLLAVMAGVISFVDLNIGPALYVVLGLVALRYFLTTIQHKNVGGIIQDLGNYSIILAASYFGQGGIFGNGFPLVHVVLAGLVLHEANIVIPQLTQALKAVGVSATQAEADAKAIVKAAETEAESLANSTVTSSPNNTK